MNNRRPLMLMILDGWGINPRIEGNAVLLAGTPCIDSLTEKYPHTSLLCSGEAVGLPDGIMGNSEVGHLNIGAGRIVYQDLLRIDMAISDRSFFKNKTFNALLSKVKSNNAALHLMGLVSNGGVHSQQNHLFALLDMAKEKGLRKVYVHAILDGRDTPPDSGIMHIKRLQDYIDTVGCGSIATICGRFYAMDRDNRWNRIERAFLLYTRGEGITEEDPVEAIKKAYERNETDEFVQPIVMADKNKKPFGKVRDKDGIIFFNFRADRAREITRAFTDLNFDFFRRDPLPAICDFVCMTMYDENFTLPVVFPPIHMSGILGETVSDHQLRQLRIAETEKYAHVTYFFNGGAENPFPLEDRCLVPSPRDVETYDLKPEMSAYKVTEEVMARLQSNQYDLIIINFANMDMVGHTGIVEAAIKACTTVDKCVGKIVARVKDLGGIVLITADHGNAESMIEEDGSAHTAHTTNKVPLILVDDTRTDIHLREGKLGDIAPTILDIMGIEKPKQMTGRSLLKN